MGEKNFEKLTDQELLSLIRLGNTLAFTHIYNKYWKGLMAYTINIVNDNTLAEDVLHDVFAALWVNRAKLEVNNLESYLFVAAKHKSISMFRKVKFTELDDHIMNSLLPANLGADSNITKDDLKNTIEKAIKELPKKCRVIFYMSKFQDYSNEEIARHFNISNRTVENQLSIALRHLKGTLGKALTILLFSTIH